MFANEDHQKQARMHIRCDYWLPVNFNCDGFEATTNILEMHSHLKIHLHEIVELKHVNNHFLRTRSVQSNLRAERCVIKPGQLSPS